MESPTQTVCTSTIGGANSGNASVRAPLTWLPPKTISAAAAATTRNRNLRLVLMIQRMAGAPRAQSSSTSYSVPYSSWEPTVTTDVPIGGPDSSSAVPRRMSPTTIGARTNTSGFGLVYVKVLPLAA